MNSHPLCRACDEYAACADQWFSGGSDALRGKEEELLAQARLGVGRVNEELIGLTNAVQTLRKHQRQIGAQLSLGLAQRDPSCSADDSVKVALGAIDSSIAAWLKMKEYFPEKADEVLTLLLQLDRLRRDTESHFPNARQSAGSN